VDWINHIKTNGNNALKEIYALHRSECVDWLIKTYNISEAIAKDAFQLSMVILYQNVHNGKINDLSSGIKTYLFGIAKNKARDIIKSESRYQRNGALGVIKEDLTQGIEQKEKFEIIIAKVNEAMNRMGDPCLSILRLFYFERMKFRDIAPLVGHDRPDTTKTRKHRCLKTLSDMISDFKPAHLGL